jgi:hypothetical protein
VTDRSSGWSSQRPASRSALWGSQRPSGARGQREHRPLADRPLPGCVASFSERIADTLAGLDHPVGLGLAGGVLAVVAVADPFQELGKFPRLSVGESGVDLDFILVLRWMGARSLPPPSTGELREARAPSERSGCNARGRRLLRRRARALLFSAACSRSASPWGGARG